MLTATAGLASAQPGRLSAGYDPSGDLTDASTEAGYASDEELSASGLPGLASDDFSAADERHRRRGRRLGSLCWSRTRLPA